MNAQSMAPVGGMEVFERFGVQFSRFFFGAFPIPRVQEFVRIVRNDSVQSFAAIIAPEQVVHENNPTPSGFFLLGLFSGFVRWLRSFRVRPLRRQKLFLLADPIRETDLENGVLSSFLDIIHDRASHSFVERYFVNGSNDGQAVRQIRWQSHDYLLVRLQAVGHHVHHLPTRARRQPPFVLDRPWEAPKEKAEKAERYAA